MPRTASVQVAAAIITVHYILSAKDGPEIIIRENLFLVGSKFEPT